MKHTYPSYTLRARHALIITGLVIAGCEPPEPAQPQQPEPLPVVESAPAPALETRREAIPARPLDLSLDNVAGKFVDTQTTGDEPGESLINIKPKAPKRIELGGNLLMDESVEDYVESVDGAKIDITIRMR